MGLLDGIISAGKSILGGDNLGSSLLRTVLTGYSLYQLQDSINTGNEQGATQEREPEPDWGVRLQLSADTETKIPVLYGEAHTAGKLVDTRMTNNNQTMHYAMVLCERTGVIMEAGVQSEISFLDLYWNNSRIIFKSDGITADYTVDRGGKIDRSISGLVKIYCYNNGSTSGVVPENYFGSVPNAYTIMPNWTSNYTADNLVFMIAEVTYSRDKSVTGLGTLNAHLKNTLDQPGDVMYDYMTNTRYGAGIDPSEIKDS